MSTAKIQLWDKHFNLIPWDDATRPTLLTIDYGPGLDRRRVFTLTEVPGEPQVFNVMNVGDATKAYRAYSGRPKDTAPE